MAKRAEDPGNPMVPHRPEAENAEPQGETKGEGRDIVLLIGIVLTCLGLIFYLARAYNQIDDLSLSLMKTRGELASTNSQVKESQDQIFKLNYDLSETRDQAVDQKLQLERHSRQLREQTGQYRSLYTTLRRTQRNYSRELKEIERDITSLKQDTNTLKQKVVQSELPTPGVRQAAPVSNQADNTEITPLPSSALDQQAKAEEEAAKTENYDFELQEQDGVLWLLNVGLDLKDVDLSDENEEKYDLEVRVAGMKIKKKDKQINEPIYFRVEGFEEPYRLVVTRIQKNHVMGYLSVPKV